MGFLDHWAATLSQFVKVFSNEYKRMLAESSKKKSEAEAEKAAV